MIFLTVAICIFDSVREGVVGIALSDNWIFSQLFILTRKGTFIYLFGALSYANSDSLK